MMRIIIYDEYIIDLGNQLETPAHPAEGPERVSNRRKWHIQFARCSDSRKRVCDIMPSRNPKNDFAKQLLLMVDRKDGSLRFESDIHRAIICFVGETESRKGATDSATEGLNIRVLRRNDGRAIEGHSVDVRQEGIQQVFHAIVAFQMVRLDVAHYGHAGEHREEGLVIFVCFSNEIITAAERCACPKFGYHTADNEGGIEVGVLQNATDH